MRAGKQERLGGLARRGYCASLKRWFHGVREHLVFTPNGLVAHVEQIPGHRHDVQGLYALLKTDFRGVLLGDNAYWPHKTMRPKLTARGILVRAASRSNWSFQYSPEMRRWLHLRRGRVERFIGLFAAQFHADRTRCRSVAHYGARRWTKALTHNCSRYVNVAWDRPAESLAHIRVAA